MDEWFLDSDYSVGDNTRSRMKVKDSLNLCLWENLPEVDLSNFGEMSIHFLSPLFEFFFFFAIEWTVKGPYIVCVLILYHTEILHKTSKELSNKTCARDTMKWIGINSIEMFNS